MTEAGTVTRTVRVRTEVAALAKTFDYAVPPQWASDVRVGTRVRVPLHGRSVRGWVVGTQTRGDEAADGAAVAPPDVDLLPLKAWLGWGPPEDLVDLAEWAAWRWAGPSTFFLRVASPEAIVRALPELPRRPDEPPAVTSSAGPPPALLAALAEGAVETMVRLPPATDQIDLVLSVVGDERVRARTGSVVVLVPSTGLGREASGGAVAAARRCGDQVLGAGSGRMAGRRRHAHGGVGTGPAVGRCHRARRTARPTARESPPTYSAVEVAVREAVPAGREASCLLVSPIPPVELDGAPHGGDPGRPVAARRAAGWPGSNGKWTAGVPTRAPGCSRRSSSGWPAPVLDDPSSPTRASVGVRLRPHGRGACWRVPTVGNSRSAPAV